jgi:hypothetical protein
MPSLAHCLSRVWVCMAITEQGNEGAFSFNEIWDPDCLLELMAHGPYSKVARLDVTIKISK